MSGPFVFLGTYRIPDGRLEDFKSANREMTQFVEANEPRVMAMGTYINEDGTEGSTVHIHPDAESLEFHLQVAAERIGKGREIVETKRIELYGKPSDRLIEQLQGISLIVKTYLHGFTRHQTG